MNRKLTPKDYLLIGGPLALLSIAHFYGGAAEPTTALWFTAAIALLLPVMATLEGRQGDLPLVWPPQAVLALFLVVLGVAAWTLIAPAPDTSLAWNMINGPGAITLDKSATLVAIIKLCGLAGVFLLGCFEGNQTRRFTAAIYAVIAIGAVWAAIGALFMMTGLQDGRLAGGFLSANSGATVYGMLAVLSVAILSRASRNLRLGRTPGRLMAIGASLFCVTLFTGCLLLTASRMGVVATGLAVVVYLLWETLSRKEARSGRTIALVMTGAVLGLVAIAGADTLWARFDDMDSDTATRGVIFSTHWRAFLDAPFFGHGLGSFSAVNTQLLTPENYRDLNSVRATHNVYIQWLEEAGIVGALPMFALIALIVGGAVRRSSRQAAGASLQRGLIAANLVVLVHATTDYALQVPSIAAFWAYLLGLQFAHSTGERKNRPRSFAAPIPSRRP